MTDGGITIDEVINILDDMRVKIDIPKAAVMQNNKNNALEMAINTMRKYQKIEEIVGNYGFDTSWLCLKKIREVVEDGTN